MEPDKTSESQSSNEILPPVAQPTVTEAAGSVLPPSSPPAEKPKRPWARFLLYVLLVLIVAGATYVIITVSKPKSNNAVTKKDVPLIAVDTLLGPANQFYPNIEVNDGAIDRNTQMFEGLVGYQDQSKLAPLLATSWTNKNAQTWDFNLKPNVKFHTGRTMTAQDVVDSIMAAKKNSGLDTYDSTIKSVVTQGDLAVEITTDGPDPLLLNRLVSLRIFDTKSGKSGDGINGTGPYMVKPGTTPNEKSLELIAFDGYHGGHVYTRALNYYVVTTEDEMAADLKSGKVSLAGDFLSLDPPQLKGTNYQHYSIEDSAVTMLAFNTLAPGPLQKLQVRQAIQQAMSLPQVIAAAGFVADPATQMITKAIPGYNPAVQTPPQDVAKAKALMKEAGYPNGVTIKLSFLKYYAAFVKEVAKELAVIGITVTLDPRDDFSGLIQDVVSGKNQASVVTYGSDLLDSTDVFSTVVQQTQNYKSKALDDNLTLVQKTIDPAQRLDILQKTSKLLSDDVATVPLLVRKRVWVLTRPYVIQEDTPAIGSSTYYWKVYQ